MVVILIASHGAPAEVSEHHSPDAAAEKRSIMSTIIKAALSYFALVFGLGFVLGTARVLVIIPRIGATAAVLLELPVMLAASWVVAGWCIRRFAIPPRASARLAMGAVAFAVLMVAELLLATLLFGQTAAQHFAAYRHVPGALGLAGQLGFAAIPALRRLRS